MRVLVGPLAGEDAALELAFAHAMVRRAGRGEVNELLRVYRPERPMVVLGRRDVLSPGSSAALAAARGAGFVPAVRATGGRAVAYTERAVVVDHVKRDSHARVTHQGRFLRIGRDLVETLRSLGVEARLGAVPGEYCPGAHSVNARGIVKLIGTAQRVIRDAWLFSSLVIVDDADRLRSLLTTVYTALGLPFDDASVGAVAEERPGIGADQVERAVLAAFGRGVGPRRSASDTDTLALARDLLPQHRL